MTVDMRLFLRNRAHFPLAELLRYRGRFVAWSPDGTRIVARSVREEEIEGLIRASGENPEDCVIGAVPEADAVIGGTEVS